MAPNAEDVTRDDPFAAARGNPHADGLFQSQPGLKLEPSFRQEDQHMTAELKPIVVSPPGYASPDPGTAAGRLVPVEQSAVPVSEDYGESVKSAPGLGNITETVAPRSTLSPEEELRADAEAQAEELPKDRNEWTKAQWIVQARAMGLAESGNKKALRGRVEDAEKEIKDAQELSVEDWVGAIEDADTADELADLRRVYGAAGIEYATADKAFDDKQAEFDGTSSDDNDKS